MHNPFFYFSHPKILITYVLNNFCGWMSDRIYLKLYFPCKMGYKLNLANPQTYSEKLQWLKLYYRKPELTKMVDKYAVKEYVASKIGSNYIIPTLGVWEKPEDIEWEKLPNQFVLKCTHDSGGIVICRDKNTLDKEVVVNKLRKALNQDFYSSTREWPYRNVPRRIIAEKYIQLAPCSIDLPDYKFFCFDGTVKGLFVATDRQNPNEEVKFDFFDAEYNHLPFRQGHDHAKIMPPRPMHFETMLKAAEKLSKGFPHVRVDFYDTPEGVLFGEMTFFHFGGLKPFEPIDWDYKFGSWLKLPEQKIK